MSSVVTSQIALGPKLAPFTPSGDGVLDHALDLLALSSDDVLFDLGCGDARILVHAAEKTGARCIGVEYNEDLVKRARTRVEVATLRRLMEHGVGDLVDIRHGDALEVDLISATALFLYLVPQGIKMLLPKYTNVSIVLLSDDEGVRSGGLIFRVAASMARLEEARRLHVRMVTYVFSIPGWKPDAQRNYKGTKIYLYNSPAPAPEQ